MDEVAIAALRLVSQANIEGDTSTVWTEQLCALRDLINRKYPQPKYYSVVVDQETGNPPVQPRSEP